MKAMPFYIMVANLTQRVLLIHWTKPTELKHFLIPPTEGLDWKVEGTPVTIQDIRTRVTNILSIGYKLWYRDSKEYDL